MKQSEKHCQSSCKLFFYQASIFNPIDIKNMIRRKRNETSGLFLLRQWMPVSKTMLKKNVRQSPTKNIWSLDKWLVLLCWEVQRNWIISSQHTCRHASKINATFAASGQHVWIATVRVKPFHYIYVFVFLFCREKWLDFIIFPHQTDMCHKACFNVGCLLYGFL